MRIELEFVELHAPLFLDGRNFGLKLYADPKKNRVPIQMYYDTDGTGKWTKEESVIVEYGEAVAIIPTYASKTPKTTKTVKLVPTVHEHASPTVKAQVSGPEKPVFTAQVSTPMDQVQGKPGRKAKYQGEEAPE